MNTLLTRPDRQETLSRVYVEAVASYAGYTISGPNFDRDGVDMRIQSGGHMRPAIDMQLKATKNLESNTDGPLRFPLKVRNYNLLQQATQTPRLLVVFAQPENMQSWVTTNEREMILRGCTYWLNITGYDPTDNKKSVTVHIPKNNMFNVESLHRLMEQSKKSRIE